MGTAPLSLNRFSALDLDGDGSVSFEEFLIMYEAHPSAGLFINAPSPIAGDFKSLDHATAMEHMLLRAVFDSIDVTGNGKLDEVEIKTAFERLGMDLSDSKCTNMNSFEKFTAVVDSLSLNLVRDIVSIEESGVGKQKQESIIGRMSNKMNEMTMRGIFGKNGQKASVVEGSLAMAAMAPIALITDSMVHDALGAWATQLQIRSTDPEAIRKAAIKRKVCRKGVLSQAHALKLMQAAQEAEPQMTALLQRVADEYVALSAHSKWRNVPITSLAHLVDAVCVRCALSL